MEIVFGLMYLVLVKVSAGRYNVNRFYNTILKRYIQPDPLYSDMIAKGKAKRFHFADPSLLHPYMYVNNNAVNWIDPEGLEIFIFGRLPFFFRPYAGVNRLAPSQRYTPQCLPKQTPSFPKASIEPWPPSGGGIQLENPFWKDIFHNIASVLRWFGFGSIISITNSTANINDVIIDPLEI